MVFGYMNLRLSIDFCIWGYFSLFDLIFFFILNLKVFILVRDFKIEIK